jgi:hypothetical protein
MFQTSAVARAQTNSVLSVPTKLDYSVSEEFDNFETWSTELYFPFKKLM